MENPVACINWKKRSNNLLQLYNLNIEIFIAFAFGKLKKTGKIRTKNGFYITYKIICNQLIPFSGKKRYS